MIKDSISDNITIYNGDCIEVMQKLIEENITVDAVITDPPPTGQQRVNGIL